MLVSSFYCWHARKCDSSNLTALYSCPKIALSILFTSTKLSAIQLTTPILTQRTARTAPSQIKENLNDRWNFCGNGNPLQKRRIQREDRLLLYHWWCQKTLTFDLESCTIENGKTVENADCFCKTSQEFFLKIVQNGYQPGMKDFMSGQIKSNAPFLLQQFMGAFSHG